MRRELALGLGLVLLWGFAAQPGRDVMGQFSRDVRGRDGRPSSVAGGGPGFSAGGSDGTATNNLLSTVMRESVQTELNLTDAQKTSIRELNASLAPDPALFQSMSSMAQQERAALMERINRERDEKTKAAEIKLKDILTAQQYLRVEQLYLQRAGTAALHREDIAAKLKMSDEQKKNLAKLKDDHDAFRRSQGFAVPREEREKQQADYEAKLTATLTPEQLTAFNNLKGPPSVEVAQAPGTSPGITGTGNSPPRTGPSPELMARMLDRNSNGSVDPEEWREGSPLQELLGKHGVDTSKPVAVSVILQKLESDTFRADYEKMRAAAVLQQQNSASASRFPPPRTSSDSAFEQLDANRNGTLDAEEWANSRSVRSMFDRAGLKVTLPLGKDDFLKQHAEASAAEVISGRPAAVAADLFDLLDGNHNGTLEIDEWVRSRHLRELVEKSNLKVTLPMSRAAFMTQVAGVLPTTTTQLPAGAAPIAMQPPTETALEHLLRLSTAEMTFDALDRNRNAALDAEEWERSGGARGLLEAAKLSMTAPISRDAFIENYTKALAIIRPPQMTYTSPTPVVRSQTASVPFTPRDTAADPAAAAFDTLDRDRDGTLSAEEWERSRRSRGFFEEAKLPMTAPITRDAFIANYNKAVEKIGPPR